MILRFFGGRSLAFVIERACVADFFERGYNGVPVDFSVLREKMPLVDKVVVGYVSRRDSFAEDGDRFFGFFFKKMIYVEADFYVGGGDDRAKFRGGIAKTCTRQIFHANRRIRRGFKFAERTDERGNLRVTVAVRYRLETAVNDVPGTVYTGRYAL